MSSKTNAKHVKDVSFIAFCRGPNIWHGIKIERCINVGFQSFQSLDRGWTCSLSVDTGEVHTGLHTGVHTEVHTEVHIVRAIRHIGMDEAAHDPSVMKTHPLPHLHTQPNVYPPTATASPTTTLSPGSSEMSSPPSRAMSSEVAHPSLTSTPSTIESNT